MLDLRSPILPLHFLIGLHVSLDGGHHADHGFFGNFQVAADAAVGALIEGSRIHKVVAAHQQARILRPPQPLAAAEGDQVCAHFGVPGKVLCGRQLGRRIHEQRNARLPRDGDAFFERHFAARGVRLVAKLAEVSVGDQEIEHRRVAGDSALQLVLMHDGDHAGASRLALPHPARVMQLLHHDLVFHAIGEWQAMHFVRISPGDAGARADEDRPSRSGGH